jgi:hypothetical protein
MARPTWARAKTAKRQSPSLRGRTTAPPCPTTIRICRLRRCGASARAWWNGGTDPHGTVYPDGHIEGGVTIDIPFGGSSGSGHAGPTSQPGPLDDPVSRSIERARQRTLFGDDFLAPMSAPSEEMGDYPTPNNYPASDGDQEAAPDESYA